MTQRLNFIAHDMRMLVSAGNCRFELGDI